MMATYTDGCGDTWTVAESRREPGTWLVRFGVDRARRFASQAEADAWAREQAGVRVDCGQSTHSYDRP